MIRKVSLMAFLLFFAAASNLRADTVQLDGTTAGTYTFMGVTYELSPYGGSLNGLPTSFTCVDIQQGVPAMGSWTATPTMLTNPANDYSNTIQGMANGSAAAGLIYLEMAWLTEQMVNNLATGHVGDATADQFAIWSFTGGPDPFANTTASTGALVNDAFLAIQGGFTVTGWLIETPDPGQAGQEMLILPANEPSGLILASTGLLGVAVFRKKLRS